MIDELLALAGDLVFERKRLAESLRRLEGSLLHSDNAKELFKKLGVQNIEGVHAEFDLVARSLDRLGALTKTLVHSVNHDRLTSSEPLLNDAVLAIEAEAARLGRPVHIDCKANEVKIEREMIEKFRPVFLEMLSTLLEFCVESPKERAARKKRAKAYLQIDVRAAEDGYRLIVVCDGNGILPPLATDHGMTLASIGVRATFEGKPGQWSAWIYHLPSNIGAFRCVPLIIGKRKVCVPAFAIRNVYDLSTVNLTDLKIRQIRGLNDDLSRFVVDKSDKLQRGRFLVEVNAGTDTTHYFVDQVLEAEEMFMKPLQAAFSANGRFMGVVVTESQTSIHEDSNELCLVINPAYLVYGEEETAHEV